MKSVVSIVWLVAICFSVSAKSDQSFDFETCSSILWKSKTFSCSQMEVVVPENRSPDLKQKNIKLTVSDGYSLLITDALPEAKSVFRTIRIVDIRNSVVFHFTALFETQEYKNKTAGFYPRKGGDWRLNVYKINSAIGSEEDYQRCVAAGSFENCAKRWTEVEPILEYLSFPLSPDDYQLCHMFPEQDVNHEGNPVLIYDELSHQITEVYRNLKVIHFGADEKTDEPFDSELDSLINQFMKDHRSLKKACSR